MEWTVYVSLHRREMVSRGEGSGERARASVWIPYYIFERNKCRCSYSLFRNVFLSSPPELSRPFKTSRLFCLIPMKHDRKSKFLVIKFKMKCYKHLWVGFIKHSHFLRSLLRILYLYLSLPLSLSFQSKRKRGSPSLSWARLRQSKMAKRLLLFVLSLSISS